MQIRGQPSEAEHVLCGIGEVLAEVALAEPPLQPNDRVRTKVLASLDQNKRFEGFAWTEETDAGY